MQYEICRTLQKQQLVITELEFTAEFEFREQMLTHNTIRGILALTTSEEDGKRSYIFDIKKMDSLWSKFEKSSAGYTELRYVFGGILDTADRCREYLLSEEELLLAPEAVFIGEDGPSVAYVPGLARPLQSQLASLCEFFMNRVDYRDEQAVVLIYGLYMSVKEESCTIDKLRELLCKRAEPENDKASMNTAAVCEPENPERIIDAAFTEILPSKTSGPDHVFSSDNCRIDPITAEITERKKPLTTQHTGDSREINGNKYRWLGWISGLLICSTLLWIFRGNITRSIIAVSVLLGLASVAICNRLILRNPNKKNNREQSKDYGYLRRPRLEENKALSLTDGPGEEKTELLFGGVQTRSICTLVSDERDNICISHLPFFIGKDPVNMDYILSEPGISRVHAKIDKRNELFELTDLNSTNGCFINGKKLSPQSPAILRRGDEICFGRSKYYFN